MELDYDLTQVEGPSRVEGYLNVKVYVEDELACSHVFDAVYEAI